MRAGLFASASVLLAVACSPTPARPYASPPPPQAAQAILAASAPLASAEPDQAPEEAGDTREKVDAMLTRVSRARGLAVRQKVTSRVLDRARILSRIREHVDKEMPPDVVDYQGEVLAALELVPPSYDFVEGAYKLIQGRIAGFYEPADRTMYMADDLSDEEAEQTLAHELVHALQDQAYGLSPILKYVPGDSDRLTAVHAVIEGDATSAMLDVIAGSAFNISDTMLRQLLTASTALSMEGITTPRILQATLTAPYADGFSFVQERRAKGGWPAVEAAFRGMPETTEQLLHPDKFESREPAIPVPRPPVDVLGSGFRAVLDDVIGEQGLRLMLEEWTTRARAVQASAGWGGDRYVVARRDVAGVRDKHEIAIGARLVFDTPKDAVELTAILKERFGASCRERAALGPLAWKSKGKEVVITAGPFERSRDPHAARSTGSCGIADAWATALLKLAKRP